MCTRPLLGAGQHKRLLQDWLAYHSLLGVDHVYVYDADGSAGPLLGTPDFATHVSMLPRRLGPRMSGLFDALWRQVGGNACVETLLVNHCLSLAKSGGYEWLVFLRGIDKFLHSGLDQGPGMLRRFLAQRPELSFLIHRRDCGRTDAGVVASDAPVFAEFTGCENRVSASALGRDFSWVPCMRPGETHSTFPNTPMMHNVTHSNSKLIQIDALRAQHFVRAFEKGGAHGSRHYDKRGDRDGDFTEVDRGMAWSLPLLRPDSPAATPAAANVRLS